MFLNLLLLAMISIMNSDSEANQTFPGASQVFSLTPEGRIRSFHSNKCLDNLNWKSNDGNPIIQYDCWGNTPGVQYWIKVNVKDQYFSLYNPLTQKCISVADPKKENDAKIVLWKCDWNDESQIWFENYGNFINQNSQKCLDIPNGSLDNVQLIQSTCIQEN